MVADNVTSNFKFNLTTFNKTPWSSENHNNWHLLDALLSRYLTISGIQGVWENALSVTVGQKFVDPDEDTIWTVLVAHTTPSTGTFTASRDANTFYWETFTTEVFAGGVFVASTTYAANTFLSSGFKYGVSVNSFTSDATYDLDVTAGNIVTLIDLEADVSGLVTDAQTAAAAAEAAAAAIDFVASDATPTTSSLTAAAAGTGNDFSREDHTHLLPTISVAKGGTGATVAATALTNLGGIGAATSDNLTNKTITSGVFNTAMSGTAVQDDDTFTSPAANKVASSESIKAYVDAKIDLEFISSTPVTAVPTIDVTGLATGYDYIFGLHGICPNTDADIPAMRVSEDNGSNFKFGATDYAWSATVIGAGTNSSGDGEIQLTGTSTLGNDAGNSNSFDVTLINPGGTSLRKSVFGSGQINDTSGTVLVFDASFAGVYKGTTNAIDAVRLQWTTGGNFKAQGNIVVWRRKRT